MKPHLGAGVLPLARSTGRVLLGMRSPLVSFPMTWGGFGGSKEPYDRNLFETAHRELTEETGYRGPMLLVPGVNSRAGRGRAHQFVGLVPQEFVPKLSQEHLVARWVDPLDEELAGLNLHWPTVPLLADVDGLLLIEAIRTGYLFE